MTATNWSKIGSLIALLFIAGSLALNEKTTDTISRGLTGKCTERQLQVCLNGGGQPIPNQPKNFPCPCLNGDNSVGAFPGTGQAQDTTSDDLKGFNDVLLVSSQLQNYYSITGMSFTDNTKELFLTARAGYVFKYDIENDIMVQWLDISNLVHNAGDKGLLSVVTHPDFANNRYVYLAYAVTSIAGPNDDLMSISYSKVIRVTDISGNADETSIVTLLGKNKEDANPLCSDSHMGGSMAFGHDGSLFVAFGDGAHYNDLDFGVVKTAMDAACLENFGETQAIGSLRSQSLDTLAGKLLRIDPATGEGICGGNWKVYNPYCETDRTSTRSRIWALGFRNPFTMNLKPLKAGETTDGPGTVYVGDVGFGSFEEINAVTAPKMNFGWPCWEGPMPMGDFKLSNNNDLSNTQIRRPKTDDGTPFSCPYVYDNVETTQPTYYYSRYDQTTSASGLFGEEYYTSMGFLGNCISGAAVYTGDSYPDEFKDRLFILDYGKNWIKTLELEGEEYRSIHSFQDGVQAAVGLEVNPNTGDICYILLGPGDVHCISHDLTPPPPKVYISANATTGPVGLTVAFSSDGSFQRDNLKVDFVAWDFRDGSPIVIDPNPVHTFTKNGIFPVTVMVRAAGFNVTNDIMIKVTGNTAPKAVIVQPVVDADGFFEYVKGEVFASSFSGRGEGGSGDYTYHWDAWLVHTNHYHPQSAQKYVADWTADDDLGASSHDGVRFNFLQFLTVTDSAGNSATSFIRMREQGWQTAFGNANPIPTFAVSGFQPYETGQYVRMEATKTSDPDLDYLLYKWDFGDGTIVDFDPKSSRSMITSHAYKQPGTYTITLTVQDNWGAEATTNAVITVGQGFVQNPPDVASIVMPSPLPTEVTVATSASGEDTSNGNGSQPGSTSPQDGGASELTAPGASTEMSSSSRVGFMIFTAIVAIVATL